MSSKSNKTAIVRESKEFRVTDPNEAVELLHCFDDDPSAAFEPITVPDVLSVTVKNYPNHNAMMFKDEVTKKWKGITFSEYKNRIEHMAKVFIKLGLQQHSTVAVLGFNCVEWFVSELAAIHAGGVITGIYTTNSVDACRHILESSKANIVIVDDPDQLEKIRRVKKILPNLKAVVQINGPFTKHVKSADGYWRWSELEEMNVDDEAVEYERRLHNIAANECCCLVYTSGTVGNPKGVMMSHDNILWCARSGLEFFGRYNLGNETIVSYLPLSHVVAQMLDVFGGILVAGTVYFADKDALKGTLLSTIKEAQPTMFFSVPRLFEKIHEKMAGIGAQANVVQRTIATWAKRVTLQHYLDRINGNPSNSFQYRIASKLILSRVKEALGFQRCRTFFTGSAPLNADTKQYFMSLDMFIYEGYGMSEAIVHTLTPLQTLSFVTVGKCLPGTRTKIINVNDEGHGEICIKGRHVFMGYINDIEKTVEAIDDDRWLHTGDLGYIDKDEYVYITGRIKEIIITSGGENIPYLRIEDQVKHECPAISNAFLIGDNRKFLSMLLTLKTELNDDGSPQDALAPETVSWLKTIDLNFTNISDAITSPKVSKAIQEAINRVNKNAISNAQKIQKFAILPHDFTVATGELTPTMKLKRNIVLSKHKDLIDKFYL